MVEAFEGKDYALLRGGESARVAVDEIPRFFEGLKIDFVVGDHVIKGTNVIWYRPEKTTNENKVLETYDKFDKIRLIN